MNTSRINPTSNTLFAPLLNCSPAGLLADYLSLTLSEVTVVQKPPIHY